MDFLDFLYQAARSRYPKGYLGSPDAVRIDDTVQLQQLMAILTMDGEMPILLHIGDQIFDYHSYLKMAGTRGSSEKNLYLLIDALTPPIGNIRIRHADMITISLNTTSHNVVMDVGFIERIGGNVLKITFPQEVIVRTEKRKSVRVNIDPAWDVSLEMAVGRKDAFRPKLENVSFGGFYFRAPAQHPKLAADQHRTARFAWPTMKLDVQVKIEIIEMCKKNGETFFRYRFSFDSYDKAMQKMESLVAHAQSLHLQRRQALFNQWELNLEKKGHH
ncbi:MAG: hypothetical protein HW380_3142 [Magnetococcales bacterium]|nr:hypothetical protein [Magnetococcales bacterium]